MSCPSRRAKSGPPSLVSRSDCKEFANLPGEITSGIFSLKMIRCRREAATRRGRNSINKVASPAARHSTVQYGDGRKGRRDAGVYLAESSVPPRLGQQRATWAARWVRPSWKTLLGLVGREGAGSIGIGKRWKNEKLLPFLLLLLTSVVGQRWFLKLGGLELTVLLAFKQYISYSLLHNRLSHVTVLWRRCVGVALLSRPSCCRPEIY